MAEDWSLDVRKYVPDADQGVIDGIIRYCGIALQKRDSSLVSFTEKDELDRVRENFLKKKLGLTAPDSELDAAIAAVGQRMKGDTTRNRVTVYYLLAERFRKLSLFGGRDAVAAAPAAASAADLGVAAAAVASMPDRERPTATVILPDPPAAQAFSARPAAAAAVADAPATGGLMRWLPWAILALALLALLWWLFAGRHAAPVATTEPAAPAAVVAQAPAPAVAPAAPTTAPSSTATVTGFPATVFFANDSAAIPADGAQAIESAAAALKTDGGKIAVTAYTDRTGDLAHNQQLARNRAVAVRDALVKAGVPEANIEMRPPSMVETGAADTMDANARRVEISRV
jgi:outer membrane protein OmpA-like peptidoglycan-associated protein